MGIYRRKDSPYWWYAFKLAGRPQVNASTGTSDKKLAQQIYVAKRSEYQKVTHEFKRVQVKLGDLINDYIELYAKHSKSTFEDDIRRLGTIKKFFGDVLLHEITVSRLEEYRLHRLSLNAKGSATRKVGKSTINREIAILKAVFNKGIEWGKCTDNPVRKIKLYNERENRRMKYLDQAEKVKLLNACPLPTKRLVFFALSTGMRQGEILNLKWKDIDFSTNTLCVRRSKSGKPRYVNINSELENMLKSLPTISEYVFGTEQGKAEFTLYRKSFEKAVFTAQIKDCVFHSLRHTFASDLVQKGVDLKTVSELLGHATTAMTERYSHLSPAHKRAAVEMLPKGLFYYADTTQLMKPEASVLNRIDLSSECRPSSMVEQRFCKPPEVPRENIPEKKPDET